MKKMTRQHPFRLLALIMFTVCAMAVSAFAAESGVISADVVNARKGPGTSYDRVEQLAKGRQVTIVGEENGWYKIKWSNSTGYVVKDYVATSSASAASSGSAAQASLNATVTGGSTINVRSGPGTGYARVTMVAAGKRVAALERSGSWYRVSFDGMTGYILGDYLALDGAASAPAAAVDTSVGNATVQGGSSVNVRSGAGTGYSRVALVGSGKRVTLLAKEGSWYKVSFDGTAGYIYVDYAAPDSGVLDTLPTSQAAQASAPTEEVPAGSSETSAAEAAGATDGEAARNGIITGGTINVRTGPGTDFERVAQVSTGKRVSILDEEDGWTMISCDAATGYVLSDYVFEGDSLPASAIGEQIAAMATQYLGVPYVYGGSSPSGFDCSGFTSYLYRQFGYSLSRSASGQYAGNVGYKIAKADLRPGDLVYFTSPGAGGRVNHTAVYIGDGQIVHARYSVGKVYLNSLSESYYTKNYVGALRII